VSDRKTFIEILTEGQGEIGREIGRGDMKPSLDLGRVTRVMNGLRAVYRSTPIQPALVALVLFQIAGGGALLRTKLVGRTDFFGSLQTASERIWGSSSSRI
jgi:hypothetical protein